MEKCTSKVTSIELMLKWLRLKTLGIYIRVRFYNPVENTRKFEKQEEKYYMTVNCFRILQVSGYILYTCND